MFSKAFGGGRSTLQADLKRVTESGVIEVPKELIGAVVDASRYEDDRYEIMKYLRECLSEPKGSRWKRVHAGLLLTEHLVKDGSCELVSEIAEGRHFDVVQRVSLLELFQCTTDKRAQHMVRMKAASLRAELVPRIQTASEAGSGKAGDTIKDTVSTCSPGEKSIMSGSTAASTATAFSAAPPASGATKPAGQLILNGIVAVGHNDDTTSESSGGEAPKKAVQYREQHRRTRKERGPVRRADDSSDSDTAPARRRPPADNMKCAATVPATAPASAAAHTVDLLQL